LFVPAENYIEIATNFGTEARRYLDESHFQAYLKKMKNDAEKVSFLYPLYPTHFHPEIGSMVGVMVPFL
jgi:hypothetical protein